MNLDLRGAIVLIATTIVGVTIITPVVGAVVQNRSISGEALAVINTAVGALIGIIASYISKPGEPSK